MAPLNIRLCAALAVCSASSAYSQDTERPESERQELANLEWGGAASIERTQPLRDRAQKLTPKQATALYSYLETDPEHLSSRLTLLFYELPEQRRARRARHDPKPHGELVLGLIENHPRSNLAGSAGLLLYPYKRDGMYTGPAWEDGIELWERLVAAHPKDPAIASNAGSFLVSDPFRYATEGPRALELFERARELAPREPKWALRLGGYHVLQQSMSRDSAVRTAAAKAALPHLKAAWELTDPGARARLAILGEPLTMVLANAYFDAGEPELARSFALRALEGLDPKKPRGDVVFEMNAVLGRVALAAGDVKAAGEYLLAAGETTGSPVLGSFGPDMTLARELLAAGEREVVLRFLVSCQGFWESGKDRLGTWIAAIEDGRDPW